MSLKAKLAKFDREADNFAAATKEPWECETYAEFLASMPDDGGDGDEPEEE